MKTEKIDWIKEYYDYCDFLNFDIIETKDQEFAKQMLKEHLEHIIASNGTDDLYDFERDLAKLLGMELDNE